jgi:hypothetical protein
MEKPIKEGVYRINGICKSANLSQSLVREILYKYYPDKIHEFAGTYKIPKSVGDEIIFFGNGVLRQMNREGIGSRASSGFIEIQNTWIKRCFVDRNFTESDPEGETVVQEM